MSTPTNSGEFPPASAARGSGNNLASGIAAAAAGTATPTASGEHPPIARVKPKSTKSWTAHIDPKGRVFYANRETRATVWQPPEQYLAELKADEEAAAAATAAAQAAAAQAAATAAATATAISAATTPSASPSNGTSTATTSDDGTVEELDGEWLKLQDPSTGNYYYANKVTGKTQWTAPPIAGLTQHEYDRVLDPATSRYYYVHKTTMAVQWEVPASWQTVLAKEAAATAAAAATTSDDKPAETTDTSATTPTDTNATAVTNDATSSSPSASSESPAESSTTSPTTTTDASSTSPTVVVSSSLAAVPVTRGSSSTVSSRAAAFNQPNKVEERPKAPVPFRHAASENKLHTRSVSVANGTTGNRPGGLPDVAQLRAAFAAPKTGPPPVPSTAPPPLPSSQPPATPTGSSVAARAKGLNLGPFGAPATPSSGGPPPPLNRAPSATVSSTVPSSPTAAGMIPAFQPMLKSPMLKDVPPLNRAPSATVTSATVAGAQTPRGKVAIGRLPIPGPPAKRDPATPAVAAQPSAATEEKTTAIPFALTGAPATPTTAPPSSTVVPSSPAPTPAKLASTPAPVAIVFPHTPAPANSLQVPHATPTPMSPGPSGIAFPSTPQAPPTPSQPLSLAAFAPASPAPSKTHVPPTPSTQAVIDKQIAEEKSRGLPIPLRNDIAKFSMEGFAANHFRVVKKRTGFSSKAMPVDALLSWQKEPISKSLLNNSKKHSADAVETFKNIQCFMGDQKTRKSPDLVAKAIVNLGVSKPGLRDEILCQLAKQTKDNPEVVSAVQGWKLLALCVATFPPTNSVEDFLFKYLYDQYSGPDQVRIFAPWCFWRLSKTIKVGPSKHPPSLADLDAMASHGVRPSSVLFGGSLEYIVYLQKVQGSSLDVPEIIPRLCGMIEANGGFATKGIFRIAAEKSEIHHLRHSVHEGKYEYKKTNDPHVPADVLKHWLRDLLEPLFPVAMYDACLKASDTVPNSVAICSTLPKAHYDTLDWLMTWLVGLAKHQSVTSMNEDNIAIVFCQDILRTTETDPQALLKNSAKEKNFVRNVLLGWTEKVKNGANGPMPYT